VKEQVDEQRFLFHLEGADATFQLSVSYRRFAIPFFVSFTRMPIKR
jgi:hypothetical protein